MTGAFDPTLINPDDWADLKCPMPVLRLDRHDNNDPPPHLGICDEDLFLVTRNSSQLLAGGPMEINDWWRVECGAGHVLMVPDNEGNDYSIPFVFEAFLLALEAIDRVAQPLRIVQP